MDHLMWDFKAEQARIAKKFGMKLIVLPTEGLHHEMEEAIQRAGKLTDVADIVDCHFVWGDVVRNAILDDNVAAPDRVHTVGCPRFDLYREPYLSMVMSRDEFVHKLGIKNPDTPLVLWATNTTYVARNQKKILRRQVSRGKLIESDVRAELEDEKVQFREHSLVVEGLAERHPDWNIIIKVHPAEWINPYNALVKRHPNLYLGFNSPIRDYLFHSDVLLQRGCTTATEAWMLGKPVLEMEIGGFRNRTDERYRAGNRIVMSLDEADSAIREYLAGAPISGEQREAREQFIADFYYRIDGKASERCAERIHEVVSPPHYTDDECAATRSAAERAFAGWMAMEDARLTNRFKDLLGIRRNVSLRFWSRLFRNEARDNLGLFVPEIEITPEMTQELYNLYGRAFKSYQILSGNIGLTFNAPPRTSLL
jgi:surface carbohydrate biosynthesis protein